MNKIAFTICSINYLAQAKTLGDSLKKFNPEYSFYIGLVDKLQTSKVDKAKLPAYKMVEISELEIEGFEDMFERYNITELNTAVKPYFIEYFYNQYPDAQYVNYFDPDIEVFKPFSVIDESLAKYGVVVTPHILTPYQDSLLPKEADIMNTGVYNLGFIATSRSEETISFLKWWQQKLRYECYIDLAKGMFVDQLWVTYAPVFWNNVLIDKHFGHNMAYWNLHERTLTGDTSNYTVNNTFPLIFFHYSGYNPNNPEVVSRYQNRFTFENKKDVAELFDNYAKTLQTNEYDYFRQFPCAYIKPEIVIPWVCPPRFQRPRKFVIAILNKLIEFIKTV